MSINFSADLAPCEDVSLECHASGSDICLTITANDRPNRLPLHCIVVLDISGSMTSEASLPNPNANPNEAQVPPPSLAPSFPFAVAAAAPFCASSSPTRTKGHILPLGPREALLKSHRRGTSSLQPQTPCYFTLKPLDMPHPQPFLITFFRCSTTAINSPSYHSVPLRASSCQRPP